MVDPTEIAIAVVSSTSGMVVAVAVLRTGLTRCQSDLKSIFEHQHNANRREREAAIHNAALFADHEARLKALEHREHP